MNGPSTDTSSRANAHPRDELLARVTRHLEEHGTGQSLRTIAAGTGTSHRMLLYHFDSHEALLTAVVDGLWRRLRDDFLVLLETSETVDARDAALRFWSRLAEAEALGPLFFELSAAAMRGAPWAEAFRSGATAWTQQLADLLVTAGMRASDAEALARTTMFVVRGALWEGAIMRDREAADATVRRFLRDNWPNPCGERCEEIGPPTRTEYHHATDIPLLPSDRSH